MIFSHNLCDCTAVSVVSHVLLSVQVLGFCQCHRPSKR